MDLPPPKSTKKSKPSFWTRLLHLSKKPNEQSNTSKSFLRSSKLHSSLRNSSSISHNDTLSLDGTTSFSTFKDLSKEAGILFVNQGSGNITNEINKESNKHVQFAPTPMNKYYTVARHAQHENKENMIDDTKQIHPILRLGKRHEHSFQNNKSLLSNSKQQSTEGLKLLKVDYIDGPEAKKTSFPRTSTKTALLERKNGSLPQLNISSISNHQTFVKDKNVTSNSQFCSVSELGYFNFERNVQETSRRCSLFPTGIENEWKGQALKKNSLHRQSCYGVSNPSRFVQQGVQNQNAKADTHIAAENKYTSKDKCLQKQENQKVVLKSHIPKQCLSNQELNFLSSNTNSSSTKYGRLNDKIKSQSQVDASLRSKENMEIISNCKDNLKIPNKTINEVGLPPVPRKSSESLVGAQNHTTANSSQYILLSETVSSKKWMETKVVDVSSKKIMKVDDKKTHLYQKSTSVFKKPLTQNIAQENKVERDPYGQNKDKAKNLMPVRILPPIPVISNPTVLVMSENRKKAILNSMYSQKKRLIGKVNTKTIKKEDGFSSMADDECSFNCSCTSCMLRATKNKKDIGKGSTNQNMFFFTTIKDLKNKEPDQQLSVHTEPITVKPEEKIAKNRKNTGSTEWYECNDSFCKTPKAEIPFAKNEKLSHKQLNRAVENVYENIAQVINSAIKKKISTQDVKKLFSTPKSERGKLFSKMTNSISSEVANKIDESTVQQSLPPTLQPIMDKRTDESFNESVVLLQEIFQKLSIECQELLKSSESCSPNVSSANISDTSINKLLMKISERNFAEKEFSEMIGSIAQSIYIEAKSKPKVTSLHHSISLPDLKSSKKIKSENSTTSLKHVCGPNKKESMNLINVVKSTLSLGTNVMNETLTLKPSESKKLNITSTSQNIKTIAENPVINLEQSKSINVSKANANSEKNKEMVVDSGSMEDEQVIEKTATMFDNDLQIDEKQRRISFYAKSPVKMTKYKSKEVLSGKAKLKLQIYHNSGLVTVHVMRAAKLTRGNGNDLNPYVKVSMVPDDSRRAHWRTNVRKLQKNPIFNQKFSFEVFSYDSCKRLVFSVWHRDYSKQRSELIGCMSFSVRHVVDDTQCVDGWYRLLREGFGTQKHFAAQTRKI